MIKELEGTNLLIAGRKYFNLTSPENFEEIEKRNIKQVYMIFLGDVLEGQGYSQAKQEIEKKLIHKGIQFIPLPKEPNTPKPFYSFDHTVSSLKENEKALVLCYHGMHNSAAYAMFHLMRKGRSFEEVFHIFKKAGWTDGSIATAKSILAKAKIDPKKLSEHMRQMSIRKSRLRGYKLNKFREFLNSHGKKK